ncbi:MAG TPA: PQQ-binding-like beta-propeller repeat protein [Verrucomicrobiota bacterium]|nr:PQQ-binding-like beta-propeller repeat protein [Verrucomicrobiota bacterium]
MSIVERLSGMLLGRLLCQLGVMFACASVERASAAAEPGGKSGSLDVDYGPFVDWVDRSTVTISWEIARPMVGRVHWSMPGGKSVEISDQTKDRRHIVTVSDLSPDGEYIYHIAGVADGEAVQSKQYKFDSSFYYGLPGVPASLPAFGKGKLAGWVAQILELADARAGYCLVLGGADGSLALEVLRQSDMQVVVLEQEVARVQQIRTALDEAGMYGVRASVLEGSLDDGMLGHMQFNLVVSERHLIEGRLPAGTGTEVVRCLVPGGGMVVLGQAGELGQAQRWLGQSGSRLVRSSNGEKSWLVYERPSLAGGGEWTHQYGNAQNTACSGDDLLKGELGVKWWGEPGPRPMPDRGPRNPAPLSTNGLLFIQGDRVLFGLDAYNGTVRWSFSSPEMRRANVPRDSSNMVAAGDRLYLVQGRYCIGIDGATGQRGMRFSVPEGDTAKHQWAYLSATTEMLIGSRVKKGEEYLGDDGEWYEKYETKFISRVTSDMLFGIDPGTGVQTWEYKGGAIINSTITIGDGMIYFIESRAPEAVERSGSIQPIERLSDQQLVALDLRSGQTKWEKGYDFSKLQYMSYLVFSKGVLVATGTDKDKHYHTYAVAAKQQTRKDKDGSPVLIPAGSQLWEDHHKEGKGHHSGHLQHPVVIGNTFYSDQWAFDLTTGRQVRDDLPERRGCGTMSASNHTMFFRHYYHGMWDIGTNKRSQFEGIRSGCWLSLISAGGMLLAPETSAGCSCTHSIQTSVGFMPRVFE